ncbi:MAG TPA: hypothetical protein VGP63_21355 [Planctomycetaceae bacterium]|nr:hypothetical protein [Planctomycetaceae bacterium]
MTRIFGLCPRCKSRIKINNVERLDGHKILCRDCGYTIRIRNPKKALVRRQSDDEEVFDLDESDLLEDSNPVENEGDEFAVAIDEEDDLPAYRPLVRRSGAKKKSVAKTDDAEGASFVPNTDATSGLSKGKKNPLVIGLICVVVLLAMGGTIGGLILLRNGFGAAGKFETPQKYVSMQLDIIPVTGVMPDGWKYNYGGGSRGIPIYLTITDGGSIVIDLRETVGSSAKGQMMNDLKAGKEVTLFRSGLDAAPAIDDTHEFNRKVVIKNFVKYDEGSGLAIETSGFGEGRISDFTGKEGYFSGTIKGCRASLTDREHQYSIVCKCPPAQFKDVRPVFEKIISGLGKWTR